MLPKGTFQTSRESARGLARSIPLLHPSMLGNWGHYSSHRYPSLSLCVTRDTFLLKGWPNIRLSGLSRHLASVLAMTH